MKHTLFLLILLFSAGICHAQKKPTNKLQQLKWMQGEWLMHTERGTFIEHWAAITDGLWKGNGYGLRQNGDTMFREQLQLVLQNDTVWYLPTVANQNEGKEVRFAAVELTDKKVVFENKQHDFPQQIVYNKTSDTTIYAYISGEQKGKMQKREFNFKRK